MVIPGLLVAFMPFELNILLYSVLVDNDIGVYLSNMVPHLLYFIGIEFIVRESDGPQVSRMPFQAPVVVLVGYYGCKELPFSHGKSADFFIGKKTGI